MPRIAVIQDGTELARQTDADITGCFEQCCALLSADGVAFTSRVFTDEAVDYLLGRLDPDEYGCVIVTSNALTSSQIERAVERRRAGLRGFVQRGGGLIVLHQLINSLAAVLPEDLCPGLQDRTSRRGAHVPTAYDRDDLLLHFPAPVALERLVDGGLPGPPSLFYKAMPPGSLPNTLKPVIAYGDEVLVARTYDHVAERVVVATPPLDWQQAVDLLSNAIRFACLGRPRRYVWRERQAGARRSLLMRWLSLDGVASIRPSPRDDEPLDATARWLLGHVEVMVVPPGRLEAATRRTEVGGFLARGGTLLSMDNVTSDAGSRVTALVGSHTERQLAARLYGELRAVTGWDAADYAFELRNIVTALGCLWDDPANRTEAAVGRDELVSLVPELRRRLLDERHREDLSSSIAHLESLSFLVDHPLDADLFAWMADDPRRARFDVGLQVRAVAALARREDDPAFVAAALAALRGGGEPPSLASVVRVLDTVAVLDQAGRLDGSHPETVVELADLLCSLLDDHPLEPGVGWLSVEATADVTRGLVALLGHLPASANTLAAQIADRLGAASGQLRQALRRYERNRKAVAWLARLTQAIVLVDRHFPIGLQRLATLAWPEPPDDDSAVAPAGDGERSLVEQLAVENKDLRDQVRVCEDARLAARVGRAAATIGATALVSAPFVYLLIRIGFESPAALIGNITVVLTMLLGIVAGVFTLLGRRHLLAEPAVKLHDWIGDTVPLLSGLSELRRR